MKKLLLLGFVACLAGCVAGPRETTTATTATLTVQTGRPGAAINPAMWGIFFEDINLAACTLSWSKTAASSSPIP